MAHSLATQRSCAVPHFPAAISFFDFAITGFCVERTKNTAHATCNKLFMHLTPIVNLFHHKALPDLIRNGHQSLDSAGLFTVLSPIPGAVSDALFVRKLHLAYLMSHSFSQSRILLSMSINLLHLMPQFTTLLSHLLCRISFFDLASATFSVANNKIKVASTVLNRCPMSSSLFNCFFQIDAATGHGRLQSSQNSKNTVGHPLYLDHRARGLTHTHESSELRTSARRSFRPYCCLHAVCTKISDMRLLVKRTLQTQPLDVLLTFNALLPPP